jgi:divalent metal cation (Fe/Co/Zn/Cd) transporter
MFPGFVPPACQLLCEGHQIAHTVETKVLNALPQVSEVLVHVEPEEGLAIERATKNQQ